MRIRVDNSLGIGRIVLANSNCSQECKYDNWGDMELKIPHLFVFKHPSPFLRVVKLATVELSRFTCQVRCSVFTIQMANRMISWAFVPILTKRGKTFLHAVVCYAKPKAFFFLSLSGGIYFLSLLVFSSLNSVPLASLMGEFSVAEKSCQKLSTLDVCYYPSPIVRN
jgi:hypothetical protein